MTSETTVRNSWQRLVEPVTHVPAWRSTGPVTDTATMVAVMRLHTQDRPVTVASVADELGASKGETATHIASLLWYGLIERTGPTGRRYRPLVSVWFKR